MADIFCSIFKNKKVNFSKLVPFGFEKRGENYEYKKVLLDSGFILTVLITEQGEASAEVIDPSLNEPYTLHLAEGATGSFVGGIRAEYEEAIEKIAELCFEPDAFKSKQARKLIACVRDKYGDELEFLWPKFPNNAIWRRKDTGKWYGALLTVSERKLKMKGDGYIEIIDLRVNPEKLESLIDNKLYFSGYHMNKKHWYTIVLDGSVPLEEICGRIDESYLLATK